MKPDGGLWAWLQPRWKDIEGIQYQRIESSTSNGTPDLEVAGLGGQAWAELKAIRLPARPTTPLRVKFEPGQVLWHEKRQAVGGRSWIVVRVFEHRSDWPRGHLVIPGGYARELEFGMALVDLERLSLTPLLTGQTQILHAILGAGVYA